MPREGVDRGSDGENHGPFGEMDFIIPDGHWRYGLGRTFLVAGPVCTRGRSGASYGAVREPGGSMKIVEGRVRVAASDVANFLQIRLGGQQADPALLAALQLLQPRDDLPHIRASGQCRATSWAGPRKMIPG